MFNADSTPFGVTRLVMINSGTVDYIELNLAVPLHLNAVNNIGKTSTINTLQFLYIDYMDDMSFPADNPATVDFYFRNGYSYLIFECVTRTGTYCIVLNRPDGDRQHYRRHIIQCGYDKKLFLQADNSIRSWPEVVVELEFNGDKTWSVPHRYLFNVFSGNLDKTSKELPNLSLLPLRDKSCYARFKMIYRSLLSMSTLKLGAFKDLLLACVELEGFNRSIDFVEKGYKEDFDKCRKAQKQYDYYSANEERIVATSEEERELKRFRKRLGKTVQSVSVSYEYHRNDLVASIARNSESHASSKEKLTEINGKIQGLCREQATAEEQQKAVQRQLDQLEQLRTDEDIRYWLENGAADALEQQHAKVNEEHIGLKLELGELEKLSALNPAHLEQEIVRKKAEVERLQVHISSSQSSMLHYLKGIGLSENELAALYRLFRSELFTLQKEQFDVKSDDELLTRLKQLAANIDESGYADQILSIALPQDSLQSLEALSDLESVKSKIEMLEQQLKREESQFDLLTKNKDKIKRRDELKQQSTELENLKYDFRRLLELETDEEQQRELCKNLTEKTESLTSTLSGWETQRNELTETVENLYQTIVGQKNSLQTLEEDYRQFNASRSEYFGDLVINEDKVDVMALDDLLFDMSECSQRMNDYMADMSAIDRAKKQHLDRAGLMYDSDADWVSYLERHCDLLAASEKVDKNWKIFLATAKTDFQDLLHCVDGVNALLKRISRSLNEHQISNLNEIKIGLEHSDFYENAREFVIEADDLFADSKKRDVYTAKMQNFFSGNHTDLRAEELFHVRIRMINPSNPSESRNITSFENESEGTNFTIKALLLSELLHEQFKHGRHANTIYFHYYLDEIGQLDDANLKNIVRQNLSRRLVPITAAPRAVIDPLCHPSCHLVTLRFDDELGRTVVDDERTFTIKEENETELAEDLSIID